MSDRGAPQSDVWTINRLLDWTRGHFDRHEVDEPRLAAEILLSTALSCKRIELYTRFDQVPAAGQLDRFRDLVKRAAAHVPISHLVGSKEFFSLDFEVSPDVLIPRPETELLVQQVIDHARAGGDGAFNFLDMGTGSGCIVTAILKYLPAAKAVATDISPEALAIAQRNASKHGIDARARFIEADRLNLPAETIPEGGFDAIVSNPPYVRAEEMATLSVTVREYEPALALTDGGDGLSFFRTLAGAGGGLLKAGGSIFVEVADGQSPAVKDIFASECFEHVGTKRDTAGPHDRALHFRRVMFDPPTNI